MPLPFRFTLYRCSALALLAVAGLAHTAPDAGVNEETGPDALTIVVEKGSAEETEKALTPGNVSVIEVEDLKQRGVSGLADAMRYVPGIYTESITGTENSFFTSRGSNLDAVNYDRNGVKQFIDGLPVTTADGNNHNRLVDPLSAHTATFARGANAQTYGASNLGGAVNYVSPTARNMAGNEIQLNAGSHGQLGGRITAGHVFNDQFDGLVSVESLRWDGYRDHNEQRRKSIQANAGVKWLDNATTRLFVSRIDNDQELAGALTEAEYESDPDQASAAAIGGDYGKDLQTTRLASKTDIQINENSELSMGLSYEDQSLFHPIVDKILVDFDGPGPNPPVEVFSLLVDTDHEEFGAVMRYNLRWGNHDLLAGLNYGDGEEKGGNFRNDGGRRNGLTTRIHNKATSKEAFVVDRWRLGDASNWTLVYGLQAVDAERDVTNIDAASGQERNPRADYSDVNPRLGVIYDLDMSAQLFANVSRLFEAPTNFELEDDVRGNNETLDPMTGSVFEIGSRGRHALGMGNSWHWDLALYYASISDEILSVDDPAAPGTSLTTNIDKTVHAGLEAVFGADLRLGNSNVHRLQPLVSVTLNDFSFENDATYGNNELPAAPDYVLRGEVLYRHVSGFYAGPTFDLVGKRYADFQNSYQVDDYHLLGLRSGLARANWKLFVELRNLLDEDYVTSISVRNIADPNSAFLNPGLPRSVFAGLQYSF